MEEAINYGNTTIELDAFPLRLLGAQSCDEYPYNNHGAW